MKWTLAISLMTALLGAVGCGRSSENSDSGGEKKSVTVNGQPANDYFNQFIAKRTGECPHHLIQRFLAAHTMLVGKNAKRQDIRADIEIFMHEDHTYTALFKEMDVLEYPANCQADLCFRYKDVRDLQLVGKWSVEGDHLVLSNVAVGTAVLVNSQPSVELRFTNDIITPGLNGQMFTASNSRGDYDENHNYICD